MLQSVNNSLMNLPNFLERHIDDRMKKMHDTLLFKADEKKRNVPQSMDVDPPPPPPSPMEDVQGPPPPTEDVQMNEAPQQQQPPRASADPMSINQVRAMSRRGIRYTAPQRITIRTHTISAPSAPRAVPTRDASTGMGGVRRRRDLSDIVDENTSVSRQRTGLEIVPYIAPHASTDFQQHTQVMRQGRVRARRRESLLLTG